MRMTSKNEGITEASHRRALPGVANSTCTSSGTTCGVPVRRRSKDFATKDTNNAKRAPRGFAGHMIGSHEALENARTFVNFSLSC